MTTLTPIGNSQGIRIPKPLIKQAKLENSDLELIVIDKGLLIKPINQTPRKQWSENIQQVLAEYENQKDEALLSDFLDDSDLEAWQW